jgi:signal transduction histidine kinase
MESVREARRLLSTGTDPDVVAQQLALTQSAIAQVVTAADRVGDSAAMLRVLASLGTQMAGFVQEINGLLGIAVAVHEAIGRLRSDRTIRGELRTRLSEVYQSVGDLRRQIERQAAFLVDITSTDARRRRSRQPLGERFSAAARLVAMALERRSITLSNDIPKGLKSPAMFPAEVTAVFSNLLTNATKAAGEGGSIRARGETRPDGGATVVIENTGVAVELTEAERWFLPFESTTTEMESALGQGMGLGLTIIRDILDQYGATIHFVAPTSSYTTALEIRFPGQKDAS